MTSLLEQMLYETIRSLNSKLDCQSDEATCAPDYCRNHWMRVAQANLEAYSRSEARLAEVKDEIAIEMGVEEQRRMALEGVAKRLEAELAEWKEAAFDHMRQNKELKAELAKHEVTNDCGNTYHNEGCADSHRTVCRYRG